MYIARATWPSANGKSYESIYLRESYREGTHVRKRNIANLTHCDPKEIAAIELALRHKNNLTALASLEQIELHQGPSVGAVWTVYQVAERLGLRKILGDEFSGHLALWQVLARVLEQGSRLSAVRLAQVHAAGAVLGWQRGFDENDLYDNLTWLSAQQKDIENRLFARRGKEKPQLFLYDVTSSYLEGDQNALGAYGYGRDGKKHKKQIVIGLLCDEGGEPVSVEVFRGNTQDTQTFAAQVNKASERFGCERVTFVGDRGHDQERTDRGVVQGRLSLHHRHHQATDRNAFESGHLSDGAVRQRGLRGRAGRGALRAAAESCSCRRTGSFSRRQTSTSGTLYCRAKSLSR